MFPQRILRLDAEGVRNAVIGLKDRLYDAVHEVRSCVCLFVRSFAYGCALASIVPSL